MCNECFSQCCCCWRRRPIKRKSRVCVCYFLRRYSLFSVRNVWEVTLMNELYYLNTMKMIKFFHVSWRAAMIFYVVEKFIKIAFLIFLSANGILILQYSLICLTLTEIATSTYGFMHFQLALSFNVACFCGNCLQSRRFNRMRFLIFNSTCASSSS